MIVPRKTSLGDLNQSHLLIDPSVESQVYQTYKYRYVIVILFILGGFVNLIQWFEFNPLITQVSKIFDVSIENVTFSAILVSNILYLPACFLSNYIIEKFGFHIGILFGTFMTMAGAWTRCLSSFGYYFILGGSCLSSFAQPFFFASAQKISSIWFRAEENALATTACLSIMMIGQAVGALLPLWFVTPDTYGTEGQGQLENLLFFSSYLATGVFVLTLLLFRDKPPTAPSRAANKEKYEFKKSLQKAFTNKNFILLLLSTSVYGGVILAIITTLQVLMHPLGVLQNEVGTLISIAISISIVVSFAVGCLISRSGKYKIWTLCFCIGSVITLSSLAGLTYTQSHVLKDAFMILTISLGIGINPSIFELMVEVSFPVAEEVTGCLFTLGFQVFGTIFSFVIEALVGDDSFMEAEYAIIFCVGILALSLIFFWRVDEELRRKLYERDGSYALMNKRGSYIEGYDVDFRDYKSEFTK